MRRMLLSGFCGLWKVLLGGDFSALQAVFLPAASWVLVVVLAVLAFPCCLIGLIDAALGCLPTALAFP